MIRIDPHVHCRDWEQSYKETVAHALKVAEHNGLSAIFDMPNTNPPITTAELVKKRLELVPQDSRVWYGLYMGLTADQEQVKHAVETYNNEERVVGFKLYAGHSTGDLAVIGENDQKAIFQTLTEMDYKGVLFVHCEKEASMHPDKWNPQEPYSHVLNRTVEAEADSVKDMIRFAKEAGFKGKLYLGHLSTPQAVDLVQEAKKDLNIFSATTFHHLILNADMLKGENGILRKVNPSLKPPHVVEELRKRVMEGKVDCLETDHAPHLLKEKIGEPHASGFPSLQVYFRCLRYLHEKLGVPQELLDRMTSKNIIEIFELEHLHLLENIPTQDPHWEDYEIDAYKGIL